MLQSSSPATSRAAAPRPTSLKLSGNLKSQVDQAARSAGLSAHAYMLQALEESSRRTLLQDQFQQDALAALGGMQASGTAYELADARNYFKLLQANRASGARRPVRPRMVKV